MPDRAFTFTFTHLADAFIQSDLHCIQVTVLHFISSFLSARVAHLVASSILAESSPQIEEILASYLSSGLASS